VPSLFCVLRDLPVVGLTARLKPCRNQTKLTTDLAVDGGFQALMLIESIKSTPDRRGNAGNTGARRWARFSR
jgi:hypothetical protein